MSKLIIPFSFILILSNTLLSKSLLQCPRNLLKTVSNNEKILGGINRVASYGIKMSNSYRRINKAIVLKIKSVIWWLEDQVYGLKHTLYRIIIYIKSFTEPKVIKKYIEDIVKPTKRELVYMYSKWFIKKMMQFAFDIFKLVINTVLKLGSTTIQIYGALIAVACICAYTYHLLSSKLNQYAQKIGLKDEQAAKNNTQDASKNMSLSQLVWGTVHPNTRSTCSLELCSRLLNTPIGPSVARSVVNNNTFRQLYKNKEQPNKQEAPEPARESKSNAPFFSSLFTKGSRQ